MSLALKKSVVMRMIFDYELDKVAALEVRTSYSSVQVQLIKIRTATASKLCMDPRFWQQHLTSIVLLQKKSYPEGEAASPETISHCEKSGGFISPSSWLPNLIHECSAIAHEQVALLKF